MKVLIVDNSRAFQLLISSLFSNTGLDPVVVKSKDECIEALRYDKYEFICISMHIEEVSGIDVCKAIRKMAEHSYVPIILFTSERSRSLLNLAIAAGVTEIFNKTTDLDQLVAYVKRFTLQHMPIEGNVLYIEDTRSLRLSTKEILQQKGLVVDDFSKAEDAWGAFNKKRYDIVITDILLEGRMSGIGLVNKIRRINDRRGDVPILAITGFDDVARKIELFHLGVNDYAIKPVIPEELMARVRNLISTSKDIERQLNLIQGIFKYSTNGIAIIDHSRNVEQANKTLLSMINKTDSNGVEKSISLKEIVDCDADTLELILNTVNQKGHWDGELDLLSSLQEKISCFCTIDSLESESTILGQYMAIWRIKK